MGTNSKPSTRLRFYRSGRQQSQFDWAILEWK